MKAVDFQAQLDQLRRTVSRTAARIDRKYSTALPERRQAAVDVEHVVSGSIVATAHGEHFETERLWERHRRHGCVDISDLESLPLDLLDSLSDGAIPSSHPSRWAFLDTETTGLAGGSGTYAFLIGVGHIEPAAV